MAALMEEDVTGLCGPKRRHEVDRIGLDAAPKHDHHG
jgi:hypothetical protein